MEQPWCELMPRVWLCPVCPMGQWLCPTGDQGESQGQAAARALADMSSTFTGPSAFLLTRALGFRRGKPKTPSLRCLLC